MNQLHQLIDDIAANCDENVKDCTYKMAARLHRLVDEKFSKLPRPPPKLDDSEGWVDLIPKEFR